MSRPLTDDEQYRRLVQNLHTLYLKAGCDYPLMAYEKPGVELLLKDARLGYFIRQGMPKYRKFMASSDRGIFFYEYSQRTSNGSLAIENGYDLDRVLDSAMKELTGTDYTGCAGSADE